MKLSVIIPVYNGAGTIAPLVQEIQRTLDADYALEIVLINDGSPEDNSADICGMLAAENSRIKFIDLARNFGEHNAVLAGLNYCTGDAAVIIDDDFQNPPSEIMVLAEKLAEGYDVVYSYYKQKRHNLFRNFGSRFNNIIASLLIGKPVGFYLSSFKIINRLVIDQVTAYAGPFPYIDGLIFRATGNCGSVLVRHASRKAGKSGYTLKKLISLWLNMFTNFSVIPLRIATFLGFITAITGLAGAVFFAAEKLKNPDLPLGWASLIVSLLVVSGIQLFAIGMVGEYLGRLFLINNGTPQFVVRKTVNCENDMPGEKQK